MCIRRQTSTLLLRVQVARSEPSISQRPSERQAIYRCLKSVRIETPSVEDNLPVVNLCWVHGRSDVGTAEYTGLYTLVGAWTRMNGGRTVRWSSRSARALNVFGSAITT